MDIATNRDAARVRSKRSVRTRLRGETGSADDAPTHHHERNGSSNLDDLRRALERAELERERAAGLLVQAEEDLDAAHQRLVDADAVRRHLLDNVASGGDEARRRFASALHDDVLQNLTAAELQLERIRSEAKSTKFAEPIDQLRATVKQVEDSLRNLLYNVSPAAHDVHVRLADAIRDRLQALKTHSGIEPDLSLSLPKRIPEAVKSVVFRNIAEAISNVEKHSKATRVSVTAEQSESGIQVSISDDGIGFVVAESLYLPGHLGLIAMRERAQLAGGWCRYESEPGTGTRVTFWIPNST